MCHECQQLVESQGQVSTMGFKSQESYIAVFHKPSPRKGLEQCGQTHVHVGMNFLDALESEPESGIQERPQGSTASGHTERPEHVDSPPALHRGKAKAAKGNCGRGRHGDMWVAKPRA